MNSLYVSLLQEFMIYKEFGLAKDYNHIMEKKIELIHHMQKKMGGQSLSPQDKIVVAIHALNLFNNLRCVNDKYQICQFPENWRNKEKGEYHFGYIAPQKKGIIKFKLCSKQHKVIVTFAYEGEKQINKVEIDKNLSLQEIVKKYQFNLHQFQTIQVPQSQKPFYHFSHEHEEHNIKSQQSKQSSGPKNQPQGFGEKILQSYPPKNVFSSNQATNPFGQEEYVGPKSQIFHNPYFQQTKVPSNIKVPPGARYDPTDPFDDPFKQKKEPDDFVGFDQHGIPLDPKKLNKPIQPNLFTQQPKPGFHLGNKPPGGLGGLGGKQPKK